MDFLQAYLHHLEEYYGKDCNKYMARLFDQKVKTFSFKWTG